MAFDSVFEPRALQPTSESTTVLLYSVLERLTRLETLVKALEHTRDEDHKRRDKVLNRIWVIVTGLFILMASAVGTNLYMNGERTKQLTWQVEQLTERYRTTLPMTSKQYYKSTPFE